MGADKRSPVLVIGLAEATLELILPWVEAGHLPTFQRLMEEGVYGTLQSQAPFITPQMWGTILTGTPARLHGVLDFWQRGDNGRFRATNGADLKQTPIWEILGEGGLRCGMVNLPFTYPPRSIRGYMISGEDAPGAHRSIANPPELYDDVVAKFGPYKLKDIFPGGRVKSDYLTLVEECIGKQTDVLEYLLEQRPTDLFMTFYSATAICQHYFWSDMASDDKENPYRSVIETAYRELDGAVGRLMRAAGPEARIFVISECGAGPIQSGININAWLAQEGFLTYRSKVGAEPAGEHPLRAAVAAARRQAQGILLKQLPQFLYYFVNRYLGGVKASVQSYLVNSGIDWNRTQVFSRGKEGNIFINLKGRDPRGSVDQTDYDSLCRTIVDKLYALVDPATGKPVVEKVYRSEELYHGPMQRTAPDITVVWRDGLYSPHEGNRNNASIFVERWREYMNWPTTGSHRSDGILFAHGPGIRKGCKIADASLPDLTPTWLHALGRPAPVHLEGRVIPGLFESME